MNAIRKRAAVVVGAVLAIAAAGVIVSHEEGPMGTAHAAAAPAPGPEVDVATVIAKNITEWQSYSGRLEAVDKVDIRPLVAGKIVAVHFQDGAIVKKGDALFTIDPKPYQAEVDRASAQLAAAEARASYASSDAERAGRLIASNAIAKRDYDEKRNAALEATANVRAAAAALDAARVNLSYTAITAPVAGRVSRAELTVGNIVSNGSNAPLLTTLVSVSPIYASFEVDEQTYLRYLRHSAGKSVPVTMGLADETGYSRNGAVVSVDNHMDTGSSTLRVRARFDNADGALLPGLYARVKVNGAKEEAAILVDDAAIGTDQAKNFVLVVDAQNKVQWREIKTGNLYEGMRIVTSGLQAGERIVVNGLMRAKPNDSVRAHNVPMAQATVKPAA
ncbi:efflux RND transporter periplasmic adaptor subunit [Pseudoduganella sp. FT25W]|uniref:Efflux RND transporter periplasmic adaptor subunit n=1 Tax=Duganella alba TaxID=2666081 RepID=A0A6L5QBR7_9BURK|nr:efflux RND transporter periplasmic adaptor subunit [Duganella alba]MRX07167.1 efflux RND transporter periplasmic adaptor subunit [Duganella alba]MRX15138.1 efflux RND transporter periplasmic adaptor subunit [Duganella alba]